MLLPKVQKKRIFVGFDMNGDVRIMQAEKPTDDVTTDVLHLNSPLFSDEYFEEGQTLFAEYFAAHPNFQMALAYVVLPNQAVGFETFNLPNMSRQKMQTAVDTELAYLYEGRQKSNKINTFPLITTKQYSIVGAIYFNKKTVSSIHKMLTDVRLIPRFTTYSGNALLDGVFGLQPKARGKNFVFADVHNEFTEIVVSSKGKTLGTAVIPHGMSLVSSPKVELEYMRTNHDIGELAVINAREAAKAKELTVGDSSDEAPAETSAEEANETVGFFENAQYTGDNTSANADNGDEANAEAVAASDDFYESEEDETKRSDEEEKVKIKKIKVFKKMPKRYPKFMLRDVPDTEEGVQFENWRIIAKWILLYARSAQLSEYIETPDFVLVNLPEDHYFLLDKMNEEQGENALQFRPFDAADKLNVNIRENLNLYGSIFANHYNKHHNY